MNESVKQLGYCNAYVVTRKYDNGRCVKTLVSYATGVAQIELSSSGNVMYASVGVYAHCSATTSKHVARFFAEYAPNFSFLISTQLKESGRGYAAKKYVGYSVLTDFFYIYSKPEAYELEKFKAWKDFYNGGMYKCKGLHRG